MLFDAPKTAGLLGLLAGAAKAQYVLDSFYDANNFFNEFSFFTEEDPTHGYVNYVDGDTAFGMNLASADDNIIRVGADSTESNPDGGRKSVRMVSNKAFTRGLIIGDFNHMPGSICGAWPAFWMTGPNWPNQGEIDIIEGVNNDDATAVTLHTGPGCTISNEGTDPATELKEADCNAGNGFTGCGQQTFNPLNYGDGFNNNEGGVYATEWTSEFIAVWFFPRGSIPQDIADGNPNPSSWGFPIAKFVGTGCDIDSIFRDHQIIINTTFCGDWAGSVWDSNEICKARAPTCNEFVGNNPQEFQEAYWAINNIAVYQNTGAPNGTITARSFNA
jgi:hypothetical protein